MREESSGSIFVLSSKLQFCLWVLRSGPLDWPYKKKERDKANTPLDKSREIINDPCVGAKKENRKVEMIKKKKKDRLLPPMELQ